MPYRIGTTNPCQLVAPVQQMSGTLGLYLASVMQERMGGVLEEGLMAGCAH
jgi:hypothetical protein